MPIKIQSDLPAKAELEEENIFCLPKRYWRTKIYSSWTKTELFHRI